jgi:GDP-6-deoxy-D-talose 4-dehydrogenase
VSGTLVTGASGLIGRRLVAVLRRRGAEVIATSRSGTAGTHPVDLADVSGVRDLLETTRPDAVVHLAGGPSPEADVYATNVLPTVHLLEAVSRIVPWSKVLVCGSSAEYGEGTGAPLHEESLCSPVNDYGRAKLAQTRLARALAVRQHLDLTVLRPFNVVAPDLPPRSPLGNIRQQLRVGSSGQVRLVCGRLDVRRDFITVDDCARAMAELLEQGLPSHVINLCSGTALSLRDVVSGLADTWGLTVDVETDPALAALPAPDVVVGDPGRLAEHGIRLSGSADAVVAALAG